MNQAELQRRQSIALRAPEEETEENPDPSEQEGTEYIPHDGGIPQYCPGQAQVSGPAKSGGRVLPGYQSHSISKRGHDLDLHFASLEDYDSDMRLDEQERLPSPDIGYTD
jgi:hypothetical protein